MTMDCSVGRSIATGKCDQHVTSLRRVQAANDLFNFVNLMTFHPSLLKMGLDPLPADVHNIDEAIFLLNDN